MNTEFYTSSGEKFVIDVDKTNFWGYRIDDKSTHSVQFFKEELDRGILRQGWGWLPGQNLLNLTVDEGAKGNLRMLNVKKGDILLVAKLPTYGEVTIAMAAEDWRTGYKYEVDKAHEDYGHQFPAKKIKIFNRHNKHVSGGIRSTLMQQRRFWDINEHKDDIVKLLKTDQGELGTIQSNSDKIVAAVKSAFGEVFDGAAFENAITDKANNSLQGAEWEDALAHGLQILLPFYRIERVGGVKEKKHGTDILIRMPDPFSGEQYAIAVQIKDYDSVVSPGVLDQINKADNHWKGEGLTLVSKVVVVTNAKEEDNSRLEQLAKASGVRVIFEKQFQRLLLDIGKAIIGIKGND